MKKANEPSAFRWKKPNLGPHKTLLHGVNLEPKTSPKIAAFDLDDTLIRSTSPNATDGKWKWWTAQIPVKLKELYEDGYANLKLFCTDFIEEKSDTVLSFYQIKLKDLPF